MATKSWSRPLQLAAVLCAVALIVQTGMLVVSSIPTGVPAPPSATGAPLVPDYPYRSWNSLPVQASRVMPLETFASERVRELTGRSRFEKQDPVSLVLAWWLTAGSGAPGSVDWEQYPFLLCEHGDLRRMIYSHREDALAGRHISPADLRSSPGFDKLLETVAQVRAEHKEKAHLFLSTAELKAEETGRRLARYDALCGRPITRLFRNAIAGEQYLNLREMGADSDTDGALTRAAERQSRDPSPLRLVALDHAPRSGWFSPAQLRLMRKDPKRWDAVMQARFTEAPHRYLAAEDLEQLRRFQEAVRTGRGEAELEMLRGELAARRDALIARFNDARAANRNDDANRFFSQIVRTSADADRMQKLRDRIRAERVPPERSQTILVAEMRAIISEVDEQRLSRLHASLERARSGYDPEDPAFRPLHLDYLELKVPDLYRRTGAAREFPDDEVAAALKAVDNLRVAYGSGDPARFDAASQALRESLKQRADEAGQAYPGVDTIALELAFNRVQPFRWAWVCMLLASAAFAVRLGMGHRFFSVIGLGLGALSVALQLFGFFARMSISGWAPVSNMYETIIFAAFMCFAFSVVLELIYRKSIFILTGALVSTIALILADNLPLDSSIGGLVPVLRSNFWLTVHVVTIVCGYAAGCLAWGVGNLTIGLLAFGQRDSSTLKMLSNFTYRALQLTVVLLATGTFLGGWWAAEAWGRFWGWDPKEVGALVALVCYVIPLHARYIGWVREFGLAVSAVLCFGSILISWYVINFVLAAGLHSYGFGGGGGPWVLWAVLLNLQWLLIAALWYTRRNVVPSAPEAVVTMA